MFVTEQQKAQIGKWLAGLQVRIHWMTDLAHREDAWETDLTWRLAAERALHTSCEYMTDISSLIIDALVMRDPGGYADILKVLVEERVFDENWFEKMQGVFEFRSQLLRNHDTVAPQQVRLAIAQYSPLLPAFKASVEDYLRL